jgi:hypothetical protein
MSEVWELSYFGQGGFPYEQVWEMPITTRKFFIRKIQEYQKALQKQSDEQNQIITEKDYKQ